MNSLPESVLLRGHTPALAPAFPTLGPPDPMPVRSSPGRAGQVQAVTLAQSYATEMTTIREQAHAAGYTTGFNQGMADAATAVAQTRTDLTTQGAADRAAWAVTAATAVNALVAAAAELDQRCSPTLTDLTDTLTATALELTRALLGRELAAATDPGLDAIRRALQLCPEDVPVRVRLHPGDLARLDRTQLGELAASITLLADPTVEPGGALAEAGARRVDAQLGTAMVRVRKVLER